MIIPAVVGATQLAALADVIVPPVLTKTFLPSTVAVGDTTTVIFTVTNPNATQVLTGVHFTDSLPTGLVVASPGVIGPTNAFGCQLDPNAVTGSSLVTLLNMSSVGAGKSCEFEVAVTATQVGSLVNTTSTILSNEGGAGNAATATLTVIESTTTALMVSPTHPRFGQPVTFPATVTPGGTTGLTPGGTVSFYLNGSTTPIATVPLSTDGTAKFTTAALPAGVNTVTAIYSGDNNFGPSGTTTDASTTVSCTTTITGTHQGSLILGPGSTCIVNASINGAVVVPAGSSLDLENSTVTGAVSATSGTPALRMCGSSASSVTVENATGFVVVGDPADGCAANTLSGPLV
ncbi:MAG TPA: Ig-like domain-containing protein, partial [Acidimicrobiales bacterium]|nr:Ig-like domain-containing protein [Acidimicrobiales bacterium]